MDARRVRLPQASFFFFFVVERNVDENLIKCVLKHVETLWSLHFWQVEASGETPVQYEESPADYPTSGRASQNGCRTSGSS